MKASTPEASGTVLSAATLLAILGTLTVNVLSNLYPLRGANIGEISNTLLRGVQITPADYAFAIWGLIYLGLIAYGIYQLRPTQRQNPTIQQVNGLLIVACLAQMVWVTLFTLRLFWPSVIAMLAILLPLIGAYLRLGIGHGRASRERKWLAHIPFSIYLGWISVATIVNVASALYTSGWQGGGISPSTWTAIMIIVAAAIGAVVAVRCTDWAFTLVLIWAFVAIALRHLDNLLIATTAIAAAVVLVLLISSKQYQIQSAKKSGPPASQN